MVHELVVFDRTQKISSRIGNDRGGMIPAFRPFDPVTRAEFGTVLSRVMYGEANNTEDVAGWYKGHLTALNNAGILTKIDMPYAQEIRSWVWIALQRTDK